MGAYWRKNIILKRKSREYSFFALIGYLALVLFESFITIHVGSVNILRIYAMNQIWVILISLIIFASFSSLKMPQNNIVNKLSKHMLGVYLIHDNQLIGSLITWGIFRKYLNINQLYEQKSILFFPLSIIACLLVIGGDMR